jgi:hypothetical protein
LQIKLFVTIIGKIIAFEEPAMMNFSSWVKKNLATGEIIQIVIPTLPFSQDSFTPAEQVWIKKFGVTTFIRNCIFDALTYLDENHRTWEAPAEIEKILDLIVGKKADDELAQELDVEELELNIAVNFRPKNKGCNFCERFAPRFVATTVIADILLSGLLGLFSMQFAQGDKGLIKLDYKTNLGVSITSTTISTFWAMWQMFSSPMLVYLSGTGGSIDKKYHQFARWLKKDKAAANAAPGLYEKVKEEATTAGKIVASSLKVFFLVSLANTLYNQILNSYTGITSMSSMVGKDLPISPHAYLILQWIETGLDHIDDPIDYAGHIYFGFKTIEAIINAKFPAKKSAAQLIAQVEGEGEAAIISIAHREDDSEGESRLVRWTTQADSNSFRFHQPNETSGTVAQSPEGVANDLSTQLLATI